jgi:hypothetical protein
MPDTKQVLRETRDRIGPPPDVLGSLDRRCHNRQQARRGSAFVVAIVVAAAVVAFAISTLRPNDRVDLPVGRTPTGSSIPTISEGPLGLGRYPTIPDGPLEPGRYIIFPLDSSRLFHAAQVTIEVPEGYSGVGHRVAVVKDGLEETGVGVWSVGYVVGDPCKRSDSRVAFAARNVARALALEKGLRSSIQTAVTVGGLRGTYMELTLPAATDLSRCEGDRMTLWGGGRGGTRYLDDPGQTELLWILEEQDIVIDAPVSPDATAQDVAEVRGMVESIRIDRN